MIRTTVALIVIILAVACSTPQQQPTPQAQPEQIKIGALLGLSGDIATSYGQAQKNGVELAVSEVNDSNYLGAGKQLKLVIADAGPGADTAFSGITSLIETDNVSAIIGPTLSSQAFKADPVAQNHSIPVIAVSNTVPGITEMGDFIFRCSLPESTVIGGTIKAAASQLRVVKVAYLWGKDDDYTIAGYKAFKDAVLKNGLKVLADETFSRGDTDFKPQLEKIIAKGPDAILVSALAKEAAAIIIQARSLGYTGIIIGGNGFNSTDVIKQAGSYAEGVMAGTAWNIASINTRNLEFISAYQKAYGIKPDQFAAQAYTGTWLLANAIRTAGSSDPSAIRDALAGISNFTTPMGSFSFTEDREPVHPAVVQIVKNGRFTIFK
ncbi:MAG: ABC transporter substrate-binding protein [Dehalococcoidia bacterium]|nr:ABC transporter substrate-binding protein [Dehalococcoidia bacterium]MDD5648493.1 ABC transporter substrate-binding protein [Dehalococcoidia bacterium]